MKINLLPPDFEPTRPSPVPYMPLGGLIVVSAVWLVAQLAVASGARGVTGVYEQSFARVSKELAPTKEIPAKLERAEAQSETLKLKAIAVTVLTQSGCEFTPILHALAETAPKSLRLTGVSLDLASMSATLSGYGSENNADVEAAIFIRAFGADKRVLEAFDDVTLNSCQSSKRGEFPVKEFSVSLKFRDRLKKSPAAEQPVEAKDKNGAKNRS